MYITKQEDIKMNNGIESKTLNQIAYYSRKYGKESLAYAGRFIANDIDKELGINIEFIDGRLFKVRNVTPAKIEKYVGKIAAMGDAELAKSYREELKSDSLYK